LDVVKNNIRENERQPEGVAVKRRFPASFGLCRMKFQENNGSPKPCRRIPAKLIRMRMSAVSKISNDQTVNLFWHQIVESKARMKIIYFRVSY
jgi:hypothetical protein